MVEHERSFSTKTSNFKKSSAFLWVCPPMYLVPQMYVTKFGILIFSRIISIKKIGSFCDIQKKTTQNGHTFCSKKAKIMDTFHRVFILFTVMVNIYCIIFGITRVVRNSKNKPCATVSLNFTP